MKTAAAWLTCDRRGAGMPSSGSGVKPPNETGGSGTVAAANGVSRRREECRLLMLVVVRAAGTGHLL